jgi:hypothetical protein
LAGTLFAIHPTIYLGEVFLLKNFLLVIYMTRCYYRRLCEVEELIDEMAREMYLRDWKIKMERTIRRIKYFVPVRK